MGTPNTQNYTHTNNWDQYHKQDNYIQYPRLDNNQTLSQAITNQDKDEVQIIKEIKGNSRKTNQIQCEVWYNETYCGKIPSPQPSPTKTKPTNTETKSRPPPPISPSLTKPTFQFWNPHLYIKPKQTMSKQIRTRRNRSVSI